VASLGVRVGSEGSDRPPVTPSRGRGEHPNKIIFFVAEFRNSKETLDKRHAKYGSGEETTAKKAIT